MILDVNGARNANILICGLGTADWWQRSLGNKADLHIR